MIQKVITNQHVKINTEVKRQEAARERLESISWYTFTQYMFRKLVFSQGNLIVSQDSLT